MKITDFQSFIGATTDKHEPGEVLQDYISTTPQSGGLIAVHLGKLSQTTDGSIRENIVHHVAEHIKVIITQLTQIATACGIDLRQCLENACIDRALLNTPMAMHPEAYAYLEACLGKEVASCLPKE